MRQLSYSAAWAVTLLALAACSTALHRCSRRQPGDRRTAAVVVSIAAINCLLPLLFEPATAYITRGMLSFVVSWLASSKALAFYCGRGPLRAGRWTAAQLSALYCLPLLPATAAAEGSTRGAADGAAVANSDGRSASLIMRSAAKAALAAACLLGVVSGPHQLVKELLLALAMYAWLGLVMDGMAAVAHPVLGLRLAPHFRPPWQATTISAFWGSCWNLAASNAVRVSVYEPLSEGTWVRRPLTGAAAASAPVDDRAHGHEQEGQLQHSGRQPAETWAYASAGGRTAIGQPPSVDYSSGRRALALCAACAASGAIHEAIVWVIAGATTRGSWFAFFSLQGPLILAERHMLTWLGQAGLKLPPAVRTALTLGTLLAFAHHLFFGPAEKMPLMQAFVERMEQGFAAWATVAAATA